MKHCYWIFRFFFMVTYKLFFKYRIRGLENVPSEGGVIIASNHLSYLDPPFVGLAIKRRATYMAKSALFTMPFLIGKFVSSFSFPVDRDNPKPSTIKEAVRRLRKGELIVMFPEGGRNVTGDITEGKRGIAAIASMSRAAVVPALIEGTDRVLPVGARFFRIGRISITFGKPLIFGATESDREFQQRILTEIMTEIKNLKTKTA